jgi:hypothetical protein
MASPNAERDKRLELLRLYERSETAFRNRLERFEALSMRTPSRLATSLYAELSVHFDVVVQTFRDLHGELSQWISAADSDKDAERLEQQAETIGDIEIREAIQEQSAQVRTVKKTVDDTQWRLALNGLEQCVQIVGVSQTEALLELACTIAKSLATLSGAEKFARIFDLIDAVKEVRETAGIANRDTRTAAAVLTELELFMTVSLVATTNAVLVVHSLTRCDKALPKATREDEARKYVVDKVRVARAEGNVLRWVCFPKDGFWIDAPTF